MSETGTLYCAGAVMAVLALALALQGLTWWALACAAGWVAAMTWAAILSFRQ